MLYINLTSNFSKLYRLLTVITLVIKGYFLWVTIFHVDESEDAQSLAWKQCISYGLQIAITLSGAHNLSSKYYEILCDKKSA